MPAPSRFASVLLLSVLSLLSAFLLFQVQPIISKFILPWFGGSPGVWTTCMLFFQVVLFLGYTYAHLLGKLPGKAQVIIHGLLLLGAMALLPIAPSDVWKPVGNEAPDDRILHLLIACVGLPYFVLSSTSPLVQVWFARGNPDASPWRLYALSNVGSLVALLSFPFFFEPRWDVLTLTQGWSIAFVLYAIITLAVLWMDRRQTTAAKADETPASSTDDESPGTGRRLLWILLPATASAVLLAATNHVCIDVAVIPFMWVVPLSLYLLTFIICFEHERWYARFSLLWLLPAAPILYLTCVMKELQKDDHGWDKVQEWMVAHADSFRSFFPKDYDFTSFKLDPNYLFQLGWSFSAMFLACMVCHGELAKLKPKPRWLTSFYLHMSAGGALGGAFVSLIAPRVFVTHAEWPLGLIAAFVTVCVAILVVAWQFQWRWLRNVTFAVTGVIAAYAVQSMKVLGFHDTTDRLELCRNFFGVITVTDTQGEMRELANGGIVHGTQHHDPAFKGDPTSYYGHDSGIGKALDSLKNVQGARVGVVGMGAGTVATYGKSGDTFRFYDINPDVPRLAQKWFTYLPDLQRRGATLEIVVSDARLALERELKTPQNFDVLLLDAFSGDSVPAHLLTREAFEIYRKHMKPDGIIAVHVTNSYLLLAPLMEKTAAEVGYKTTRISVNAMIGDDQDSTDYVLMTNNEAFLAAHPPELPDEETQQKEGSIQPRVWTDRHHDLFQILMLDLD